jgi:hypothetical protein
VGTRRSRSFERGPVSVESCNDLSAAVPDRSGCATVTIWRRPDVDDPEAVTNAPRLKRKHTWRTRRAERSAIPAIREFKVQGDSVWQRRSGAWKKICCEFLPLGFVVSPDGLTAAVDALLPDGSEALIPAAAISEDGLEALAQWAAYNLIDLPEPRAAGVWLREVVGTLSAVRRAPLKYAEEGERSSRHLVRLIEKATGSAIRRED